MPRKKEELCSLCDNNPIEHPKSGVCKACYAFVFYWKNRSVTDIVKRQDTLERWNRRMALFGQSRGTNTPAKPSKAKKK